MRLVLKLLNNKLYEAEKELEEDKTYLKDVGYQSLSSKWALSIIKHNERLIPQLKEAINKLKR